MTGVVLGLVLAGAPTMRVDPASTCAPTPSLRRELARSPVELVEGHAEFVVSLAPMTPGLRLEIRRADGSLALERTVPTSSCPEALAAAAVIIDRFVREIAVSVAVRDPPRRVRTDTASATDERLVAGWRAPDDTAPAPIDAGAPPDAASEARRVPAEAGPPGARPPTADSRASTVARPDEPAVGAGAPSPPARAPLDAGSPSTPERSGTTPNARAPGGAGARASSAPIRAGVAKTGSSERTPAPEPTRSGGGDARPGDPSASAAAVPAPPTRTPAAPDGRPSVADPRAPASDARGAVRATSPTDPRASTPSSDAPAPTPPADGADSRATSSTDPAAMRAGDSQQGPGPPPGEPLPLRLALSAGGGLVAPTPSTISPLLALDVALGLGERWRLGLMAAFSFGGAVDITDEAGRTRGRLSSRDVTVLGEGLVCTSGRLSLCGGLRAGVRLGIGSASGPFIFQTRTAFAVTPALGPAGRLTARFGRFFLTADVTGLVNLTTPALTVDGLPTTIPTPRLEALGWLGAGLEGP